MCAFSRPGNAANSSCHHFSILPSVLTGTWTPFDASSVAFAGAPRPEGLSGLWHCRVRSSNGVGRMHSAHWRTERFRGGGLGQLLQWLGARGPEPFEIHCVCVVPSAALERSWGCRHPVPSAWSGHTASGGCKFRIFFLDLLCLCSRHCS